MKISRVRVVIKNPVFLESYEDDDEDELDLADLAPLRSCVAPIVTASTSKDEHESELEE